MIITVREIAREDLRHLYCADPRLRQEVARAGCPGHRSVSSAVSRICTEPVNQESVSIPRSAA